MEASSKECAKTYGKRGDHANVCMEIYELYDDLVDMAREAAKSHRGPGALEDKIRGPDVSKFLYENGEGKMVPVSTLVKIRI